jgi:hypothetical protein
MQFTKIGLKFGKQKKVDTFIDFLVQCNRVLTKGGTLVH